MASAQEVVKGYLIVNIEEASGKTSRDHFTWDTNIGSPFETFVKGAASEHSWVLVPFGLYLLQKLSGYRND